MAKRIKNNIERQQSLELSINGKLVSAYAGETIAAVLFAENISIFYRTANNHARAAYCNMGTCFECQVKVEAETEASSAWVRACMTPVAAGMRITCGEKIHGEQGEDKQG